AVILNVRLNATVNTSFKFDASEALLGSLQFLFVTALLPGEKFVNQFRALVSTLAFAASVNSVFYERAIPVFVDSKSHSRTWILSCLAIRWSSGQGRSGYPRPCWCICTAKAQDARDVWAAGYLLVPRQQDYHHFGGGHARQ